MIQKTTMTLEKYGSHKKYEKIIKIRTYELHNPTIFKFNKPLSQLSQDQGPDNPLQNYQLPSTPIHTPRRAVLVFTRTKMVQTVKPIMTCSGPKLFNYRLDRNIKDSPIFKNQFHSNWLGPINCKPLGKRNQIFNSKHLYARILSSPMKHQQLEREVRNKFEVS